MKHNVAAKALQSRQFQQKIIPNKKKFPSRKKPLKVEKHDDAAGKV